MENDMEIANIIGYILGLYRGYTGCHQGSRAEDQDHMLESVVGISLGCLTGPKALILQHSTAQRMQHIL